MTFPLLAFLERRLSYETITKALHLTAVFQTMMLIQDTRCICKYNTVRLLLGRSRVQAPAAPYLGLKISCFLARRSALRGLNQDWLSRCQDKLQGGVLVSCVYSTVHQC